MKIKVGDIMQIRWCERSRREGESDAAEDSRWSPGGTRRPLPLWSSQVEREVGLWWDSIVMYVEGIFKLTHLISKSGELHLNNNIFGWEDQNWN